MLSEMLARNGSLAWMNLYGDKKGKRRKNVVFCWKYKNDSMNQVTMLETKELC